VTRRERWEIAGMLLGAVTEGEVAREAAGMSRPRRSKQRHRTRLGGQTITHWRRHSQPRGCWRLAVARDGTVRAAYRGNTLIALETSKRSHLYSALGGAR